MVTAIGWSRPIQCAVNFGRLAVPFETAEYGGAGDLQLAAFFDYGFIERIAVEAVALRKVKPQQLGGMRGSHGVTIRS